MAEIRSFYPWGLAFTVMLGHFSRKAIIASLGHRADPLEEGLAEEPSFFLVGQVELNGFETREAAEAFQFRFLLAFQTTWIQPLTDRVKAMREWTATLRQGYQALTPEIQERLIHGPDPIEKDEPLLPVGGHLVLGPINIGMGFRGEVRPGVLNLKQPVSDEEVWKIVHALPKLALAQASAEVEKW